MVLKPEASYVWRFPVVGSCVASALKFINKVGLQSFRNSIFKSGIIVGNTNFSLQKIQTFTSTYSKSCLGDAGNVP